MGEPTNRIMVCHGIDCPSNGALQPFLSSRPLSSQELLDLRERRLNGREVGGIRWQEQQTTPDAVDQLFDLVSLMSRKIVYRYYLASPQAWAKQLPYVCHKRFAVYGALQGHSRTEPVQAQRCNQGNGFPVVARSAAVGPLTTRRAREQARHRRVHAALIYEDEVLGRNGRRLLAPFLTSVRVPL